MRTAAVVGASPAGARAARAPRTRGHGGRLGASEPPRPPCVRPDRYGAGLRFAAGASGRGGVATEKGAADGLCRLAGHRQPAVAAARGAGFP
ncbi:hypothetical protein SRB17_45870 [Streptomyces sp. RB17]|nr:hypothetical protein [Streptomyces sp. RB17]